EQQVVSRAYASRASASLRTGSSLGSAFAAGLPLAGTSLSLAGTSFAGPSFPALVASPFGSSWPLTGLEASASDNSSPTPVAIVLTIIWQPRLAAYEPTAKA